METIAVESWEQLATVPVAVAIALVVVQFAKLFASWGTVGWKRLSAVTAVVVMVGATILGGADVLAVVLAAVNGLVAGVAASEAFDAARDALSGSN